MDIVTHPGTEYWLTLLGLVVTVLGIAVTATVSIHKLHIERGKLEVSNQQLELAKRELAFQSDALDFSAFLQDWQNTACELNAIIAETEIDRILILRAWNGVLNPLWTTAVYQLREEWQQPRQYIHFELDQDYVTRLRELSNTGQIYFITSEMEPIESKIKQVYLAEGVRASYWAHIETVNLKNTEAKAITYISFSTHAQDKISESTRTRCMVMASRLKGIAANFRFKDAA